MQADVILKEPRPMSAPPHREGTRRGGRGLVPPRTPLGEYNAIECRMYIAYPEEGKCKQM